MRQRGEVNELEGRRRPADVLPRHPVNDSDGGAEYLLSRRHARDSRMQRINVERPSDPKRNRYEVGRTRSLELVEKPNAFLRE
jgi:hypothetical protein